MRENCARVLAAALMTGAIAAAVAMSAVFGTPAEQAGQAITAPPSSLQRSVRAVALPAPRPHRRSVERLVATHPIKRPARAVISTRRLVIIHTQRASRPPRRLASVKPKTKAKPAVVPVAQAPAAAPVATPPVAEPTADVEPESDKDHGNGNAFGHDKEHGHGHDHGGHED